MREGELARKCRVCMVSLTLACVRTDRRVSVSAAQSTTADAYATASWTAEQAHGTVSGSGRYTAELVAAAVQGSGVPLAWRSHVITASGRGSRTALSDKKSG